MFCLSNSLARWPLLFLTFIWCFNRSSQANECLPQLADTCFKKLSSSLDCRETYLCDDPVTFCELLDDSLQCSADIIDSDCSEINGKDKFDSWYKGLRAVYSYMCHPMTNNGTRESALHKIKSSMCWNKKMFIECVGEMLNIHHVVDMLKTSYDYKECIFVGCGQFLIVVILPLSTIYSILTTGVNDVFLSLPPTYRQNMRTESPSIPKRAKGFVDDTKEIRMVIAMTNCNVNSQSTDCAEFQGGLINDLVFIFFSQQKCTDFRMDLNGVPFPISPNYVFMSIVPIIILLNLFK